MKREKKLHLLHVLPHVLVDLLLEDGGRVAFRYCAPDGTVSDAANPNGSVANIAGILNEAGNVLGMMPHPERLADPLLGGTDGAPMFQALAEAIAAWATRRNVPTT